MAFLSTPSCTTVVIAIERCLCVLFSLKAQTLMSTRTMAILLLTITLLLQLGFATFPLRMTVVRMVHSQTGQSVWLVVPGQGPNQELLAVLFKVVFDLTLLFVLNIMSVFVVVICTVMMVVKLKLALAWRLTTSNSPQSDIQTQQTALTKVLVVVCAIYVACSAPGCVMALARRIQPEYSAAGKYANIFRLTHALGYEVFSAALSMTLSTTGDLPGSDRSFGVCTVERTTREAESSRNQSNQPNDLVLGNHSNMEKRINRLK